MANVPPQPKWGQGQPTNGTFQKPTGPRVTIDYLTKGQPVSIFHRYCQDPNGYFMVQTSSQGILHPSVGKTDGWTEGVATQDWDARNYNVNDFNTWPEIRWTHGRWYNRRGHKLDVSRADMTTQRVMAEQIRKLGEPSEANNTPLLSLFQVRWGGNQPVNPVTEGQGGWGQIGSTPSDNYINGWENTVFQMLGPTYEIISTFIQSSEELLKLHAGTVRPMLRGSHVGALYFLWPIGYQDGHEFPAYVQNSKLLSLMVNMESSGVPTRFPHNSHLYKVFASKEWTSQMCLHPLLKTPLTTMVSHSAVVQNHDKAAAMAMTALNNLAKARTDWAGLMGQPTPKPGPINHGVAKLGWSWEAMDVRSWKNKQQLSNGLLELAEQPGSFMESVFVQEWVDFDVEMRHFIVEPNLSDPETWKPKKIIYTVFKAHDAGCFRDFDRYDRNGCLRTCFQNDDAALADAEAQAQELIGRWLQWLQAQSHELPVVTRFDILAKRTGPGKANIMTGELTELGGCFLGWPEGPGVVMSAMLRSCFKDASNFAPF